MPTKKPSRSSKNKSISINGDVRNSNVFIGDNNLFQKIINYIFPSEKETLEQRNRRILLNHVENAWIKGVLDASLHGAALLDLGITQDPEAVTQYPWAIQKESTKETLSAGTSMLEIFDSIGMGRSLLILGAPGSGKTTMLLELARRLIARAREDVTQPTPMVFNLTSWTEKLSLADWLAQELNTLYSVPRKTAPDWVKGNKLLLLLDGLDEVRQESRAKCVEAINEFRKQNGLTSLAVCSRSQDYADLNTKLSFEGAIEVQPLTQGQITEFFNRFGDEMAGIKQVLKKDNALREMAETPLFLSIILMAYRDKQDVEILASEDEKAQREHLFDAYIEHMFKHPRMEKTPFERQDTQHWLSWLAKMMIEHNQVPYSLENMQPEWLHHKEKLKQYKLCVGLFFGLFMGLSLGLMSWRFGYLVIGLFIGLFVGFTLESSKFYVNSSILNQARGYLIIGLIGGAAIGLILWLLNMISDRLSVALIDLMIFGMIVSLDGPGGRAGSEIFFRYYIFRFILSINNLLPWRLVPFLDHCVDLIFLRRVGDGYIFIHRLLMEHFAEMYVESPTSKGTKKTIHQNSCQTKIYKAIIENKGDNYGS